MSLSIFIAQKSTPFPNGTVALGYYLNSVHKDAIKIIFRDTASLEADGSPGAAVAASVNDDIFGSPNTVARLLGRAFPDTGIYGSNALDTTLIDQWLDFTQDSLSTTDFKLLGAAYKNLDHYLTLRSFFVGYNPTLADFAVWGALKNSLVFARIYKTKKESLGTHLVRWYDHISSIEAVQASLADIIASLDATKNKTDQGKFDIPLQDATYGSVVTRFPPEPSGYLHIGHAKAALLNQYFANTYGGRMIVRFDDTNPSKEKTEFEDTITEDLVLIGIDSNTVAHTHTSDYFEQIYELALKLIKDGKAYVDDTDQITMRSQRMEGIASKCRDASVEENLRRFDEMAKATDFGQTCCLRAKISVDDPNKAMRDPVIYRCNTTPHHRTGDKWKIYPTYDFACPIVDSIEGVTHALRTNEYRDRNPQYYWMLEALGIRKVHIWDFSRINFVYTLLSKRKLQWFVDQGYVSGWDDPRFPTIRGIRRRGMTIEALKQYILMQGASQNTLLLEWDKLWALNKKVIDPIAPRHTAIATADSVKGTISGGPEQPYVKELPKHKKNLDIGMKKTAYSSTILLEQEDAKGFEVGEEITLMDWGNAFIRAVHKDNSGVVKSVDMELHLEGDFKKTKKKITWLSDSTDLVEATLLDYDYLITKKKVEEGDEVKDLVTPVTEFKISVLCDANVAQLNKGDIIQHERKGYYIVDRPLSQSSPVHFIAIPDGKASSMASKVEEDPKKEKKVIPKPSGKPTNTKGLKAQAGGAVVTATSDQRNVSGFETPVSTSMYKVENVYGEEIGIPNPAQASKMYIVENLYTVKSQ